MKSLSVWVLCALLFSAIRADDPTPEKTLEGHEKGVLSVSYSRDGSRLACGSEGGLTRIWDTKSGEPVLDLEFNYSVNGVTFTKDGKTLITGTWGAQIWDLAEGIRKNHLEAHTGFLTCVAESPNGKIVATGGLDSTVKLWDPKNWQEIKSLPNPDQVNAICFSGDGKKLAVAGDTMVTIWAAEDWKTKQEFKMLPATSVALDAEGKKLYVGGPEGGLSVVDTENAKPLVQTKPFREKVTALSLSQNGKRLAAACRDGFARLLSAEDLKETMAWKHPQAVTSIAFSPDGSRVATGCKDTIVRIWKVE
jgi:WD40 repeat protein